MRTIQELKNFYDTVLISDITALEGERKKVARKVIISWSVLAALVIVVVGIVLSSGTANDPGIILVPVVIAVVIGAGLHWLFTRDYTSEFKFLIIQKIVNFLDEGLNYSATECIQEGLYMLSQLFPHRVDRYRGDDLVVGKLGATEMKFSELHSEYKTTTTDSKGHTRTHWHTIFKGLFFVGDFNKDFKGRTLVLPDTAEKLFGNLGSLFQSWNKTRGELIKLEDPEFEKMFAVYGNDQIEARYILSTSLMKRIVDFKKKSRRNIYLSFIASKVFVAVSYHKNLFEPKIFTTLLDFKPIQEYFEDLQLAIGIVEDLNLNTRIWTK
ncbi:DUF3137 domain-containing protein [Candidatus Omnitrophota bacterium]